VSEDAVPLRAERIHLRHRGADHDVVRDLSLEVRPGEILALVGPNGSGKSSAVSALARSFAPRSGRVRLGDRDVWSLSRRAFARRVCWLPQSPMAVPGVRVRELVMHGRHAYRRPLAPPSSADRQAVERALRSMELLELRDRPLETLSGGERRRAWFAVALAQEARILLLDEPTSALDLRHQWDVLELLARLNREQGVTVAVVLHDLEQAAALAHRMAILHRGRLYDVGAPAECLREDMLRDVYAVDGAITKEDGTLRVRVRGPADPMRRL